MTKPVDYKQFYKSPWGMAFIFYFVAMGLVGALTPPDILTAYTWTKPFTDLMASIVPQIDKVTALGIDADINRFYFSVMWAGSPVLVLMYVLAIAIDKRKNDDFFSYYRSDIKKLMKTIILLMFVAFISYHIEWLTSARTRLVLNTFGTNLGRFFMPQVFVITPVICSLPPLTWMVLMLINRKTK